MFQTNVVQRTIRYSQWGNRWQNNTVHALCILDK